MLVPTKNVGDTTNVTWNFVLAAERRRVTVMWRERLSVLTVRGCLDLMRASSVRSNVDR